MTKDSNDNIETIEAEEINPSDSSSNSNIPKRKGGRPKKTDKDILSNIPHYFITQPNDVTQAISNLTAVERNCWLQIIRGIQRRKIFLMGILKIPDYALTYPASGMCLRA